MAEKTETKRIGITVDNYKLKKFQKALIRAGYGYRYHALTLKTSLIYFDVDAKTFKKHIKEVTKICTLNEINFKQSN